MCNKCNKYGPSSSPINDSPTSLFTLRKVTSPRAVPLGYSLTFMVYVSNSIHSLLNHKRNFNFLKGRNLPKFDLTFKWGVTDNGFSYSFKKSIKQYSYVQISVCQMVLTKVLDKNKLYSSNAILLHHNYQIYFLQTALLPSSFLKS